MIMIISIILLLFYLFSCFLTLKGVSILSYTYANPHPRSIGMKMLLMGFIIRFLSLLFAWLNGLPLYIFCIGQLFPIGSIFISDMIVNTVRKKKITGI